MVGGVVYGVVNFGRKEDKYRLDLFIFLVNDVVGDFVEEGNWVVYSFLEVYFKVVQFFFNWLFYCF